MASQDKNNPSKNTSGTHEPPLPQEIKASEKAVAGAAHEQAERDMEQDPDLSFHSPNDDLDEGETARLGEEDNPIT